MTSSSPDTAYLVPSSVGGDPAISSSGVGSPDSNTACVLNVVGGGMGYSSSNLWFLDDNLGVC